MKFLQICLSLALAVALVESRNLRANRRLSPGRIVGGAEATPGQFPFHVSMSFLGGYYCGGSILDHNTVLSAAHCCNGDSNGNQVTGGNIHRRDGDGDPSDDTEGTEQVIPIAFRVQHPNYNSFTLQNDLCIAYLEGDFVYNDYVSNIPMPELGEDFSGGTGVVSGFGSTDDNEPHSFDLLWTSLSIISDEECRTEHAYTTNQISDEMLCALYDGDDNDPTDDHGVCGGDSGSPLTCTRTGEEDSSSANRILCGVVSWGGECGSELQPPVFQEVSKNVDWIRDQMAANGGRK